MSSELFMLLNEIEKEKGISRDVVIDALSGALLSAYKKNFGHIFPPCIVKCISFVNFSIWYYTVLQK
mgnify:CR=1 FL=1